MLELIPRIHEVLDYYTMEAGENKAVKIVLF